MNSFLTDNKKVNRIGEKKQETSHGKIFETKPRLIAVYEIFILGGKIAPQKSDLLSGLPTPPEDAVSINLIKGLTFAV